MTSVLSTRGLEERKRLVVWAAACAGRVLGLYEDRVPGDERVRAALIGADGFARGEIRVAAARALAADADRAAQETPDRVARAAAHAAGHAIATAHLVGHARHAAAYAADAVALAHPDDPTVRAEEQAWQRRRLPDELRHLVDGDPGVPTPRPGTGTGTA